MATPPYANINKANWNERAVLHAKSPGYDTSRLLHDATALSDVVQFDLPLLGSIEGLDIVHLQCHIGTDTISLARRGPRTVVGLDFSAAAITAARDLAANAAGSETTNLKFVEADVNHADQALGSACYDLVFTGIGALCWLPSITQWAHQVASLLRPGGRLFLREGHPVMWAVDETLTDAPGLVITYPYFETSTPVESVSDTTYVDTGNCKLQNKTSYSWNHGIGEIMTALIEAGMAIMGFVEHQSIPWVAFPGQMEPAREPGEWKVTAGKDHIPLSYTLQAVRK